MAEMFHTFGSVFITYIAIPLSSPVTYVTEFSVRTEISEMKSQACEFRPKHN